MPVAYSPAKRRVRLTARSAYFVIVPKVRWATARTIVSISDDLLSSDIGYA